MFQRLFYYYLINLKDPKSIWIFLRGAREPIFQISITVKILLSFISNISSHDSKSKLIADWTWASGNNQVHLDNGCWSYHWYFMRHLGFVADEILQQRLSKLRQSFSSDIFNSFSVTFLFSIIFQKASRTVLHLWNRIFRLYYVQFIIN